MRPRENWDPKLVWVLRNFQENEAKWNPKGRPDFKYHSPRFFVVSNNKLITTAAGINGWTGTIRPALAKLVGD